MSIEVTTKDCAALGDAELGEMADLTEGGVGWTVGQLGKQAEEWVLVSSAAKEGRLKGFMFTTLERIGGTPAMLIGLAATAPGKGNDAVLQALMKEQFHRALMAFPDEDVLVAGRVIDRGGLDAFQELSEVCPCDDARANGEERAWGRRLSKRFGALGFDDRAMVARGDGERLVIDHQSTGDLRSCGSVDGCDVESGDYVIAWGWAMVEHLETLG